MHFLYPEGLCETRTMNPQSLCEVRAMHPKGLYKAYARNPIGLSFKASFKASSRCLEPGKQA